ncbi:MAG: sulfite exporter TauE/SafE family protein [Candidatus Dadabacteria bacterium]|nr:sulfite exporter TauE/SafE family protein [Candidatus Dadabacteria bacterium]MYB27080.1 sulfite exporter TauE/SafE family protein [Candidatus Dadabacteria bacterium]
MQEYDLFSLVLLFFTGVLAGVINVMAGGGSSIVLPVLIFLGIDPTVANGTNRVAILFQNFFAALSFRKEGVAGIKTSVRLAAFTLPGVLVGAFAAVRVGDELFEKILAVVLIFVCASFFLKVDSFGKLLGGGETGRGWVLYPALVLIGFYGGFIQVGVGLFIMAALYHLMGASLAKVNAHKVIVVLIYTIPAILIFFLSGNISWFIGICLAAGNSVGGWFGATFSVRGGEKYIRMALVVAVGIMALKLLRVF